MGDVVVSSNMGLIMIDPQFMVMLKGNKNSFHHESAGVDMPNPPGFVSTGLIHWFCLTVCHGKSQFLIGQLSIVK